MSGTFEHLQAIFRATAELPSADRIQWIRQDRWIHHMRADEALRRLSELLTFAPCARMPCLLLYGAPGMGKTKIVQKFSRDHPSRLDEVTGTTHLPIVAMQMPPEPLERDFYEELLIAMGGPVSCRANLPQLRHQIRLLARRVELRLLIIDEIHAMLAGTFRQQRIFLNTIRFLANDLRLPLACVGTYEGQQALLTDLQLADRFEAFELPAWRDDASFTQLLKSFGSILPLRQPSDLCQPDFRKRLLGITEGVMVRICRVVEQAAVVAIQSGVERIDLNMFTDEMAGKCLASLAGRRRRGATGPQ